MHQAEAMTRLEGVGAEAAGAEGVAGQPAAGELEAQGQMPHVILIADIAAPHCIVAMPFSMAC